MTRSRTAASLFAASAIIAASLLGAAPAGAATLPTGATIDVVETDQTGAIYSVNPANAVASLAGSAAGVFNITAIDVNQSGQGYAIGQDEAGSFLYSANAVTGALDLIAPILDGGETVDGCQGIDLSAANVLTVSCSTFVDSGFFVSVIGFVNPVSGEFDEITDYSTLDDDIVRALASNAAGTLYYITELGHVFILNTTTGVSTPTVTVDGRVLAADFDITDQLWVTIGAEGEEPIVGNSLGTLNIATGVLTPIAEYTNVDEPEFSTVSITVWGGSLAATGSNGQEFVPIAIGAVLLLLAGVALAVTRRISHSRRNSAP